MHPSKAYGKFFDYKNYKIRGWFSEAQRRWYQEQAKKIINGTIVEVGVFGGLSLLSIVEICKVNETKLIGIDPWELLESSNEQKIPTDIWHPILKECRTNLETIISELKYDNVTLKQAFSPDVANNFNDESLDLIFIDGDHSTESVYNDLRGWFPKLKRNKLIAGHDFGWKTVQAGIKKFSEEFNIEFSDTKVGIWTIEKK